MVADARCPTCGGVKRPNATTKGLPPCSCGQAATPPRDFAFHDIDRAKFLADAVRALPHVRLGLKEKTQKGCPMRLEVEAYEDEGEAGGVGHGSVLLPVEYADDILKLIETKLAADLSALGVTA